MARAGKVSAFPEMEQEGYVLVTQRHLEQGCACGVLSEFRAKTLANEIMHLITAVFACQVRGQTPKVAPQDKKKTPKGRAKKRILYNRRFVNVGKLPHLSKFCDLVVT